MVPAGNVAVVRFDAVLATDLASFDTAARAAYASGVAAMVGGGVVASDVSLQLAAASLRVTAVIRCRAADADARAIASRLESLSGPKLATALAPFVAVAVESVSSPSVAIVPKEGPVIPISDGPGHTPSALTRSDSASEERFTTVVTALSACVGLLLLALVAVLWGRGWFRRRCGRAKPGPTSSTTHRGVIGRPAPPLVVELVSPLPAVTPSYMGPSCTPTLGGPLGYGPCISERLSERGSFSERGSVADGAGGAAGSSGADASVESSPAVWAQYEEKGDEPTPPSYGSMREEEEPALPLALPGMAAVTLGGVPVPTAQGTFLHSFEGERGEPDVDGDGTMRI